jgi:hypothetical protein
MGLNEGGQMVSVDCIWQNVSAAVCTLCEGQGTFEERLSDAFTSNLLTLGSYDATAEIAEDLKSVLLACDRHVILDAGKMKSIDESDRRLICRKLVNLLVATSRMTQQD